MFSLVSFVRRNWASAQPKEVAKNDGALRVGLFGASKIAPMAIITPAKTHPDVVIASIAARDESKAKAYAKKHNIPKTHTSYQALLDDPAIDAVYIPLPNGLHYEWAVKALKANKHVLLEKPSTSNAVEAESLFHHPILAQPNAPVLLEAFHSTFHPAWRRFVSLLEPENIADVKVTQFAPKSMIPLDDIRFKYDLAGGVLMDFGTYGVAILRSAFGTEPEECIEASHTPMPNNTEPNIDFAVKSKWRFPNGGIGVLEAQLVATGGWSLPWLTSNWPRVELPRCVVEHKETTVVDQEASEKGQTHSCTRNVTFYNFLIPSIYHRIDVRDTHIIKSGDGKIVKTWIDSKLIKNYVWDFEAQKDLAGTGELTWSSYRYELEEFVNRIRKRPGNGVWFDAENSIKQMKVIDGVYTKMGLPLRPTSKYLDDQNTTTE